MQNIVDCISSFNPAYYITLNFSVRYSITRAAALAQMTRFIEKLNNYLFGRSSQQHIRILPVLEMGGDRYAHKNVLESKIKTNWHFHVLIEDPFERSEKIQGATLTEVKSVIADIWGASPITDSSYTSRHDGLDWFQKIYSLPGVIEYIFKEPGTLLDEGESAINQEALLYELANNSGVKQRP